MAEPASVRHSPQEQHRQWLILMLVWIACGLYAAVLLPRGWVPHDEGTIAQSAQRVLEGQLPHRDFDELYTGGLTYLNALAFRLFGETLLAPRIMLYLFFLAWVPAVYRIASRFSSALAAAAVTLLAVAWSLPNYSAALPSWYNLFFATFGVAAILRYLDTGTRTWLLLAGLSCGVSFLFKLSGVYFAAGVLLFLVFREQDVSRAEPCGQRPRIGLYSAFVLIGLGAFVFALIFLLRRHARAVTLVEVVVPALSVAVFCVVRELAGVPGSAGRRFSSFFRTLLPFALGAALPVLLFLIPYFRAEAVADFLRGVFVLPGRRIDFAAQRPIGFALYMILSAAAVAALLLAAYANRIRARWAQAALAALLFAALWLSKAHPRIYLSSWAPLPLLIPLSTLAALWVVGNRGISLSRRHSAMLLVAVTAACALIQFPFSAPIYFCYVAPLLALSLAALFSIPASVSRPVLGLLLAFYFAFAVFRVTPGFIHVMGYHYQPDPETTPLRLERAGGLRVDRDRALEYQQLIPEIQAHAGTSAYIYAAPDCPEVYFLAGKRNPTRTMFDFFEDAGQQTAQVLEAISRRQVQVVVLYSHPEFSGPLPPELAAALRERFSQSETIGQFEVRWLQ